MALIKIPGLEELDRLGLCLARNLPASDIPPIFLRGPLGAGKTSLVRAVVSKLENSGEAEIGSPSFNIYNFYPSSPPVFHFDLYRCRSDIPDALEEALDDGAALLMLEWAEFLPPDLCPADFLDISFNLSDYGRLLELASNGPASQALLDALINCLGA